MRIIWPSNLEKSSSQFPGFSFLSYGSRFQESERKYGDCREQRRRAAKIETAASQGAGEMAEWLKAHAWKACLGETLTWVRIPLSPPYFQ